MYKCGLKSEVYRILDPAGSCRYAIKSRYLNKLVLFSAPKVPKKLASQTLQVLVFLVQGRDILTSYEALLNILQPCS